MVTRYRSYGSKKRNHDWNLLELFFFLLKSQVFYFFHAMGVYDYTICPINERFLGELLERNLNLNLSNEISIEKRTNETFKLRINIITLSLPYCLLVNYVLVS